MFAMKNKHAIGTCANPVGRARSLVLVGRLHDNDPVGFAILNFGVFLPPGGGMFFSGGRRLGGVEGGSSSVDVIVRTSACIYVVIRLVASSAVVGKKTQKSPRH